MKIVFWIIKNVQTIWAILSEHKEQIAIFLTLSNAIVNILLSISINRMQATEINENINSVKNTKK